MGKTFSTVFMMLTFTWGWAHAEPPQKAVAEDVIVSDPGFDKSLAVLLSLQPLPISLGHLYARHWGTGVFFTIGETLLAAASMGTVMAERSVAGLHDHDGMTPFSSWSPEGQVLFFSALSAYVLVKIADSVSTGFMAPASEKNPASERS